MLSRIFVVQIHCMEKITFIVNQVQQSEKHIHQVLSLLEEGATVPFIARYRKERTGGMDEVAIASIRDAAKKFDELIQRKTAIIKSIEEQGKLTDELKQRIVSSIDINELEDLYLPYKQKRLTRGEKAKKLGLEPLAKLIMSQRGGDPEHMAERFVKGEVEDESQAIASHDQWKSRATGISKVE